LNDRHIDYGQSILRSKFSHISGLQSTVLQQRCSVPTLSNNAK
jgi:hypothetical protein